MSAKKLVGGVNPISMMGKFELSEIRFLLDHSHIYENLVDGKLLEGKLGRQLLETALRCFFTRSIDIFQDVLFKFVIQAVDHLPVSDKRFGLGMSPADLSAIRASSQPHRLLVQHLIRSLSFRQKAIRRYCGNLGFGLDGETEMLIVVRNYVVHCDSQVDAKLARLLHKHRRCRSTPGIKNGKVRFSVRHLYSASEKLESVITEIEDILHDQFGVRWCKVVFKDFTLVRPAQWYKQIEG